MLNYSERKEELPESYFMLDNVTYISVELEASEKLTVHYY
jgi:hypothetical protein